MIEYRMDEEAYRYLCEWADDNPIKAAWSPAYSRKSATRLKEYPSFVLYTEEKARYVKYSVKNLSGLVIKGEIYHTPEGEHEFSITGKTPKPLKEEAEPFVRELVRVLIKAYIHGNAFMWNGNFVESKKYIAAGRNEGEKKIITFRKYRDSVYAVPCGTHKSPEGIFSVRGHFRHLQNGNVIWIDEFMKGLDD